MVNYKRIVCEVVVLAVLAAVTTAAPAPDNKEEHYDQRQNGTENHRFNIDGVVIAVAPVESFLAAASDIYMEQLFEEFHELQAPNASFENSSLKPDESNPGVPKPQESKPEAEKAETPLNDVSLDVIDPETKGQKKDAVRKQVKGQRLKTLLANVLVPLIRSSHTHEN